ncbi:MAG TPA: acyl-CoA dehydrogenase family protein [Myxococcota bacterium]|nr:acyl-CoA dehydrogenase family protein [Myxococcota bacterium]
MDFALGEKAEKFRAEVRAWLAENLTPEVIEHEERTGDGLNLDSHRKMAARGWVAANWPREYGGQERDPYEMYAMETELQHSGYPRNVFITTSLVGNTLRVVGSERQKREILPRIVRGELIISLGYSEPHCGSDIADARTRAERDGDDWLIHGQKMFTTGAHLANYVFVLARTDASLPKRQGLTLFLVPTDLPGFEAQAVHTLGGERTNLTFYSGVRVPDWLRVGELNGGWDVMKVALALEQGVGYTGNAEVLLDAALAWARRTGRISDPIVRERLARVAQCAEVGTLLEKRSTWAAATGDRSARVAGPMAKLYSSEIFVAAASDLMDLLGADALARRGEGEPDDAAMVEFYQRFCHGTTIYAGTSEVMRSQIAEAGLGLPRSRAK